MNYEKAYKEALERAKNLRKDAIDMSENIRAKQCEIIFPELKESEDEKIRKTIIRFFKDQYSNETEMYDGSVTVGKAIAWLEKQGSEPNWCHHKVDLSNCSEEYRKAYCDGWNNCNMQHSQCKSEGNDVVKCLINGMKFYYEGNEEATWGTEKFSMKVKDILSWLEKQGEPNPYSGTSFKYNGHSWGMCARDNGVEVMIDRKLVASIKPDGGVESMVQSYAKRLANECNVSVESPLVKICLTSFRHGIENTIDELELNGLNNSPE